MKDYTVINVLEDKLEFSPKIYTVGDIGVPWFKFKFAHLFNEESLAGYKLEIRYNLPNGYIIDEYTVGDNNELEFAVNSKAFYAPDWVKVLAILKKDADNIITLPGEITVRVRNTNVSNEEIEPVYEILIQSAIDNINIHLEAAKADLENFEKEQEMIAKNEINIHTTKKATELDDHTTEKKSELNHHTEEKKVVVDNYVDDKFQSRLAGVEVFNMFDKPNTKLKSVLGVQHGRFGYWDRDSENPTNIELAQNWQDNGVFSDLPKPVVLDNGTMHLDIDYDEYIEPVDEIAENELYRVVKSTKGHIELTRYHAEIIEEEVVTSETRYHEWVYYPVDEAIENFEELWSNSWLWEECEQRGDCEVVINRKHNEIVIGKIIDEIAYTGEDGTEFFNPVWKHKHLPMYPLTIDEIFAEADRMFEVQPLVIEQKAVPTGDYEIAGQVLEDRLDLGEGYENLISKCFVGQSCVVETINNSDYIMTTTTSDYPQVFFSLKNELLKKENRAVVKWKIECSDSVKEKIWVRFTRQSNGNKDFYKTEGTEIFEINAGTQFTNAIYVIVSNDVNLIGEMIKIKINITKTSEPKPFIKNSRPDSKLALPQLATLGEVTSVSMQGNHLVAQHENGTAIIKDAKINSNAPLSSLHWGIQAYKDASGNKRLFVSTADGTYPVGWENIKYDDESVNTIFYDVARNSTSNNIAGLITEEDGKLNVYIGEGYENVGIDSKIKKINCASSVNNNIITVTKTSLAGGNSNANYDYNPRDGYSGELTASFEITEANFDLSLTTNLRIALFEGYTFISGDSIIDKIGKYEVKFSVVDSQTSNSAGFYLRMNEILDINSFFKIKNFQITKTSTPKPFTEGIVPKGALKIACDWTSENKSFVFKGCTGAYGTAVSSTFMWGNDIRYASNVKRNYNALLSSLFYQTQSFEDNTKSSVSKIKNSGFHNTLMFNYPGPDMHYGNDSLNQILIYNNPNLTQAQLEGELAKDIYLPTYHHQPNSIINTYGISGMGAMYLYQPALTSAEIDEELQKDVYMPATPQWDIPNYKGE